MNKKLPLADMLNNKNALRNKIDETKSVQKSKDIALRDLSFIHIEELTFEDKYPHKEAVENIISSIRIDGISFVYLLFGNQAGVSFYFGIARDKRYPSSLDLDVDEIAEYILQLNIEGNFRGSKTTFQTNKQFILDTINSAKRFARVDGIPSVNEDRENFQGIDRLVDVMMGDEFGLMIIADPLSNNEIQEIEHTLYQVYNKLLPLCKVSVQANNGETVTDSASTSSSETTADGSNTSNSNSTNKQASKSTSEVKSSGDNSSTTQESGSETTTTDKATGTNESTSKENSNSTSHATAKNTGSSETREFQNKRISEWITYIDEVLLKRLDYGRNKGIFHAGIYLFANENGTLVKLGHTIRAIFSGTDENQVPLKVTMIQNENEIHAIKNLQLPSLGDVFNDQEKEARVVFSKYDQQVATWMSLRELSVITALPQKEVVGLPLKEEVEFGLNIKKATQEMGDNILLGHLVKSGSVLNIEVSMNKHNLNKHTFITGVTGSGKTTTCQRILTSAQMPFMVIEPAKTEYRVLTTKYDDITLFTLGSEKLAPFRLNPFEFFEGENIASRVDLIKANIEAAFDMEAAIPQIIEAALYRCYENYGWDIATSSNNKFEHPFADGVYAFPTLSDLIAQAEQVTQQQGFDDRLKNDYIGSIKARLQGLIIGAKGYMLNTPRSVDFKDLVERNVIIELEEIKSTAEKSLIMGFILINLNEAVKIKYKAYKAQGKEFKHITLIEEAHRLLSKYQPGDNTSKILGVETFTDMLAEVRKYGESLIIVDQIPNKLTPEVLKNTNTKIVHKLFASDDKEAMGNTMALKDEQKEFLSNLEVGRAIVSSQDFARPIQVQIKELEDISTTLNKLVEDNDIRQMALLYYQKHYKKGIIFGLDSMDAEPSLHTVEDYLMLPLNRLEGLWKTLCSNIADGDFTVDMESFLTLSKLDTKLCVVSEFLKYRFYQAHNCVDTVFIQNFLQQIMKGSKSFNREEKAKLKIRP